MKRTLQKCMGIVVLLGLVIPAQATTYLDVKFLEVIEQSPTWPQSLYLDKIESYLVGGANVNQQTHNQETPVMRVVNLIARDGEAMCACSPEIKRRLKNCGVALTGVPLLIGMSKQREGFNEFTFSSTRTANRLVTVCGCIMVLYSAYSYVRALKVDVSGVNHMYNMEVRLQTIKLLLKHPAIDLTLKNSQGKTVLDLIRDHKEIIKRFDADSSYMKAHVTSYAKAMNEIEALLKAKLSEPITTQDKQ